MGLFSSIFGGDDEVPEVALPSLDSVIPGVSISDSARQVKNIGSDLMGRGFDLSGQIQSQARQLDQFPTLSARELFELNNAEKVYRNNFALAQNNVNNQTGNQINSLSRTLALQGVNTTQGGTNALFSGIAAANQASLNTAQSNMANQLLSLRQNLLSGAYQRQVNKLNAMTGLQGQFMSQGGQLTSNLFNLATNQQAAKLSVDQANQQAQIAMQQASDAQSFGLGSSLIGGGISLLGSVLGGGR